MSDAADIILQSIVVDPTKIGDVKEILKGCRTSESRAAALRAYCSKNLRTCLALETEVIKNVVNDTSWDKVVSALEAKYGPQLAEGRIVPTPIVLRDESLV